MARGDHLFVYCTGYSHHGIDSGNGLVVHFESDPWRKLSGTIVRKGSPAIREVSLDEFSGGRPLNIRQYESCDDVETVMERARIRIGEVGYDVFGNNCEHFAVWCKTGKHVSTQVESFREAVKPLGSAVATSAVIFRVAPPPRSRAGAGLRHRICTDCRLVYVSLSRKTLRKLFSRRILVVKRPAGG